MRRLDPLHVPLRGRHLIEAGAGTGKTYTITSLVLRLIAERGIPVSDILVVTFTEAATAELKDRIRERLRNAEEAIVEGRSDDPLYRQLIDTDRRGARLRIHRALQDFDSAAVSTIHGFLNRVLSAHAFESGVSFDPVLLTDTAPLLREVAHEFFANEVYPASDLFVDFIDYARFTPDHLRELLAVISRRPEIVVLPETLEVDDPSEAFNEAFFAAKGAWATDRDALLDLLMSDDRLTHRSFNRRNVPRWGDALTRYLNHESPLLFGDTDNVQRFSTEQIRSQTKENEAPPTHPLFDACEGLLACVGLFERRLIALKRRFAATAVPRLQQKKREANLFTYDDMLTRMRDALHGPRREALTRAVRNRYTAVLIDEFQDTDPVQYRIFDRIYRDTDASLFFIGDPKQSIYAFRGADIFTYFSAATSVRDNAHTLNTNWRSGPRMITAINALFRRVPRPFYYEGIAYSPVSPPDSATDELAGDEAPFDIRFVPRHGGALVPGEEPLTVSQAEELIPRLVAEDMARLLQRLRLRGRPLRPAEAAILVRTNDQARTIQAALKQRGIPGVVWGASSVFESKEASMMATVLAAIETPSNPGRLRALLSTELIGLTAREIAAIMDPKTHPDALDGWTERLCSWRERFDNLGAIRLLQGILDLAVSRDDTVATRLLRGERGERAMTNLRHLAELMNAKRVKDHLSINRLLEWFMEQCGGSLNGPAAEDAELELESDEEAVRIITVHKAKGLEFELVYCPYLWKGLKGLPGGQAVVYHNPDHQHRAELDLGSDELERHRALAREEQMAEELRLAYVALTRAKQKTVVLWGLFSKAETSALGYLFHRPEDATSLDAIAEGIRGMTDEALAAQLEALSVDSSRTVVVNPAAAEGEDLPTREEESPPPLTRRTFDRRLPAQRSTLSFTAMTARADFHDGPDYDEVDETRALFAPRDASSAEHPLMALEPGPRTGNLLHEIYEDIDFTQGHGEEIAVVARQKIDKFELDPDKWTEPITRSVRETLGVPLDQEDGTCRLSAIPRHRRTSEMAFIFPLDADSQNAPPFPETLADLIHEHCPNRPPGYVKRVRKLKRNTLHGFMKGFIDLVFEHNNRYYILDYKSNFLGHRPSDYAPHRLLLSMGEHHYILQYLIYTLALHRFLKARLPDYDSRRHFGGVYYLFLRGIAADAPPGNGVFYDRPADPFIEALSGLLTHRGGRG